MMYLTKKTLSKILTLTIALLLCSIFSAPSVFAADLIFSPNSGSYNVGQIITATVAVDPAGDSVNAVETSINFDPKALYVLNVSKGPALSIWTTEPTFSNLDGVVTFGGKALAPFATTSNLLTVTFKTITQGPTSLSFTESSILEADATSTDVFENAEDASYVVTLTPTTIISEVFFDPNLWYSETDGLFTWALPPGVNAVAAEITTNKNNAPEENESVVKDPPIEELLVSSDIISEGVQYVSVNFKNEAGWGTPANRKLQIDTTEPEPFIINVQSVTLPNSFPLLKFEADDITSGIDYYEIKVANQEPLLLTPNGARAGYLLRELEDGTYTVKVVAYDMAGNMRESSVEVPITAGWVRPTEEEDEGLFSDFVTATNVFILFLLLVLILLSIYIWDTSKQAKELEIKLRHEIREIQDQMEKIFLALRDEIYDQVISITKRKKLTANEKQAVDEINQALEVSETLIEKEINDVRNVLK